jgi:hypothetical protein
MNLLAEAIRQRYGRLEPFGTLEPGDGSERCLICGWRATSESFYIWAPAPFPVCSRRHAIEWLQLLGAPETVLS